MARKTAQKSNLLKAYLSTCFIGRNWSKHCQKMAQKAAQKSNLLRAYSTSTCLTGRNFSKQFFKNRPKKWPEKWPKSGPKMARVYWIATLKQDSRDVQARTISTDAIEVAAAAIFSTWSCKSSTAVDGAALAAFSAAVAASSRVPWVAIQSSY